MMCGGYGTQQLSWSDVVRLARLPGSSPTPLFRQQDYFPLKSGARSISDWNCAPIVREGNGSREAVDAAWGLVPRWWDKPLEEKEFDTYNARLDRVRRAKSYRHALHDQRCLVPASWFYEYSGPAGSKTRHRCSLAGEDPLLLMGLWDYNAHLDLTSFTVITTDAGPGFARFRASVPAIAATEEVADAYLAGDVDEALALAADPNDERLVIEPPEPVAAA